MSAETHEFQAEVQKLLDLMIHSLYTNKDVFLRELVSNASDALDRRRFQGLTDASLLPEADLGIELRVDADARTLSVSDNGLGMSRDEVRENLGTIARSGTLEYMKNLEGANEAAPELIGQFGVGFYASFMVADRVEVLTRKAGEDTATHWISQGAGSYSIEEGDRDEVGTTITLHLKTVDGEDGVKDYADEWVLRQIVKRYSDFVAYPIGLVKADTIAEESNPEEAEGDALDAPLNSMKAIWLRPEDEVDEDAYREFYSHISHDHEAPLLHVRTNIEGTFEARALLYVPSKAPFDLYHREMAHRGIQLYVRRVFIMDECRELMPEYLRFIKGVVDAEDLSLNVSREMLQQDRQIVAIRKHLVKKVLDALSDMKKNDTEKYLGFWSQFGPVLKEGLLGYEDEKKDRILDLVYCTTTADPDKLVPLSEVVERMAEGQDQIYFMTGAPLDVLARSPHVEAFKAKGIEVCLFADPVDEVWLEQMAPVYKEKSFQSVGRGEVDLDADEKAEADEATRDEKNETFKDLLDALRAALQDDVKEVRLSGRLTDSPSCLVLEDGDLSPQLEAMLRQAGQAVPERKPILEINPDHRVLEGLQRTFEAKADDARIADYAGLLYSLAVLAEGGQLADPVGFTRVVNELMVDGLAD